MGIKKRKTRSELETIPGIGKSMAQDFNDLGYYTVASIRGQDPQQMYDRLCLIKGCRVDRCVLYAFRCAVYFASNENHEPEKLKWWNWKDGAYIR